MNEQTTDVLAMAQTEKEQRHGGLLVIGIFKLSECLFFLGVGLGAQHLVHKDLGDEVMRFATGVLHQDPEGHLVRVLMEKTDLIDAHELLKVSLFAMAYAVVKLVEGVGLLLQQVWAEYLTLGLTVAFLPWEVVELVRGVNWVRVTLLVTNLLVLAYLVWFVQRKRSSGSR